MVPEIECLDTDTLTWPKLAYTEAETFESLNLSDDQFLAGFSFVPFSVGKGCFYLFSFWLLFLGLQLQILQPLRIQT